MSAHVEWADAEYVGVEVATTGERIGEHSVDAPLGLVLGADSLFVIEGDAPSLRRIAQAITTALDRAT